MGSVSASMVGLFVVTLAHASADWVQADAYATFEVVVSETAPDSEKLAAQEFQKYWKETTGCGIPVLPRRGQGVAVWVGRGGVPDGLLAHVDLDGLGTDGLCLRSVGARDLLIVGGRERGTLYGVYEFFERYMGVRWLTAGVTHVPEAAPAALPNIGYRYVPQFLRRRTTYSSGLHQAGRGGEVRALERVQRLASHVEYGSHVHTVFTFLPPGKYFAEHPEYYSEIGGKRIAPVGVPDSEMGGRPELRSQLCFSNPEVADALVAELLPRMRARPEATVWDVSQMDWDGHCECAPCRAIDEREGTHMGSLLTCINRVAAAVETEFPRHCIETLAYQHTRKPPKNLRPRDNVIIALCNIECDFSRPMDDPSSEVNRSFYADLSGWVEIPCTRFFWDYPDNVIFQAPFPNFHVMQPNMQVWARSGFTSAYYCSNPNFNEQFGAMKAYLIAKLMWNPDCNFERLKEEFIRLYYKEAGPYLTEYIALLTQTLEEKQVEMDIFDELEWIDYDLVLRCEDIFKRAFAAAESDDVQLRLRQEYASVQFQAMIAAPRLSVEGGQFTVTRPPCLDFASYAALLDELSVPTLENESHLGHLEWWVGKTLPQRHQASPIEILENEHSLLWIAPAIHGTILRWHDKANGVELLDDIREYGRAGHVLWHTWQDWCVAPEEPPEGPVAGAYTVVTRDADSITLQASLDTGLTIQRRVRLIPGTPKIELQLTVSNTTETPRIPKLKIHPEFYTHGAVIPEIWADTGSEWRHLNADASSDLNVFGALADAQSYVRWAAHFPEKGVSIVNAFNAAELDSLLYFYNAQREKQHANLELLMARDPIKPGGRRTLTTTYHVTNKEPERL